MATISWANPMVKRWSGTKLSLTRILIKQDHLIDVINSGAISMVWVLIKPQSYVQTRQLNCFPSSPRLRGTGLNYWIKGKEGGLATKLEYFWTLGKVWRKVDVLKSIDHLWGYSPRVKKQDFKCSHVSN